MRHLRSDSFYTWRRLIVKPIQILGVVVFVVGVILLGFAYHASNAPLDQLSNTLTGRFTDRTMWYVVLGAAAAVGGVLLFLFGKRR
jgi:drug/metabolite transporter (DMT)-like permease